MSSIRDVRVRVLEVPFREPVEAGRRRWERRGLGLVELTDEAGRVGVGEMAPEEPAGLVAADARGLAEALVRILAGVDAADGRALAERVATLADDRAAVRPIGRAMRAAVDAAGLDLTARAAGLTAARCLSPDPAERVRVNGLVAARDEATAVREARACAAGGFTCLKLKAGREPLGAIVARARAVRAAVGPAVALRIDVNGAWADVPEAAAALGALGEPDDLRLEYVEQPLPGDVAAADLRALRDVSPVPIAADESVTGLARALELLEAGAVDALVVKPARVGGPRPAFALATAAARFDVPVTISTLFETGVGLAAALHVAAALPGPERAHGLATADLLASDLLLEPLPIRDGRLGLPAGAGLGIRLDPEALRRYAA